MYLQPGFWRRLWRWSHGRSLVMLWMAIALRKLPSRRMGITLFGTIPPGLARRAPRTAARPIPKAQWPSHNYSHLMEQPTDFSM